MKRMLLLSLLFVNANNFGMGVWKHVKNHFGAVFKDLSKDIKEDSEKFNEKIQGELSHLKQEHEGSEEHKSASTPKPTHAESKKSKSLPRVPSKEMLEFQRTQRQNINGLLISLLAAGICKFNANQSHPAGDAYFNFNMAAGFSLGVSATLAYKFFTTHVPAQIEHK